MKASDPDLAREERILRSATPWLLRAVLATALLILISGLLLAARSPASYVHRFEQVHAGHLHVREDFAELLRAVPQGDPHAVLSLGLLTLTLVPLARVVMSLLLFLRVRDYTYALLTAYVLLGLAAGILLGGMG